MPKAVAILEVMWDWEARTSRAGYAQRAPGYFRINGENFTGKRLYDWLGHHDLLVTNACPELVSSAKGRGKPDAKWLQANLDELAPFELLIVCGKVAQATFAQCQGNYRNVRIVQCPHPAFRLWSSSALSGMRKVCRSKLKANVVCTITRQGKLEVTHA